MEKLEKFKQDLERYSTIVSYFISDEGKRRIADNVIYLDKIYDSLKKESDFFRSASTSYTSARKLMKEINKMNLDNILKKLTKINEKKRIEGKLI